MYRSYMYLMKILYKEQNVMVKLKLTMRMCLYEKIFGHNNGHKGLRSF